MSYQKLRGAIRAKYGTQANFARAMKLSNTALSNKLNRKTEWTRQEIEDACQLLGIPIPNAHAYFFAV